MADDEITPDEGKLAEAKVAIYEAIGQYVDGWHGMEGDVVTKFFVVAEVIDESGGRSLVECNGYAGGDTRLMAWDRSGLLFECLHDPVQRMRER